MNLPTVQEMKALFTKVNSDCMRDSDDSIPFIDTEYYAEQIEVIYEVTEEQALELATKLKEA